MILNEQIIKKLKEKSGLLLDQAKDFGVLSDKIFSEAGRNIGVTTLNPTLVVSPQSPQSTELKSIFHGKNIPQSTELKSIFHGKTAKYLDCQHRIITFAHKRP